MRVQNKMAELAESHRLLAEAQSDTKKELKAFIAAMNLRFGSNGRGENRPEETARTQQGSQRL